MKIIQISAIFLFFLLSVKIYGEDKKYLLNRVTHLIKILNELQEYAKSSADIKLEEHENKVKSERMLKQITLIVKDADSVELKKELAVLVWHIGTFDNISWAEEPTPRVYLTAFDIITRMIAEDLSDEAVSAMQSISNRIQLGAGESLSFDRRKARQLKKREEVKKG